MTDQDGARTARETIEVSEKTKERFESQKAAMDAADPHVPDMADEHFLNTLLDTLEAAQNGYYETAQEDSA